MTTLNDKLEAYLKARPNRWIPATAFERVAGRQGWRTRLSNCRRQRSMTIENRLATRTTVNGDRFTLSWYRYVPSLPAGQATLFEAHGA